MQQGFVRATTARLGVGLRKIKIKNKKVNELLLGPSASEHLHIQRNEGWRGATRRREKKTDASPSISLPERGERARGSTEVVTDSWGAWSSSSSSSSSSAGSKTSYCLPSSPEKKNLKTKISLLNKGLLLHLTLSNIDTGMCVYSTYKKKNAYIYVKFHQYNIT